NALTCFKAYDIRGRLGEELNEDVAYRVGRAFAEVMQARTVVIGRDCRASSEALMGACVEGVLTTGADVLDLGLCGTEEMYHATAHFGAEGGIEVTASHNPMDYNGMKLVREGAAPIGAETGMAAVRALAESGEFAAAGARGMLRPAKAARMAYVQKVLSFVDIGALRPLRILVNAGNGAAGPTFDAISAALARRGA
ncbi:MAG: phosphomannomutase, partial [Pararhodobacter sp.]